MTIQPNFQALRSEAARAISGFQGLPPARAACMRRSCVPQLVAAAAAASPDAAALWFDGQQVTYAGLEARASQLGAYLRSLGAGPETPVAICLERGFDYVVAALAAWKAGAAYLPIDPSWPGEHRAFVAKDAQAQVLVTRSPHTLRNPAVARFIVDLDADAFNISRAEVPIYPVETRREDLAYIIYTFGSPGRPKGVEVTHGNLLNLVIWHRRTFSISPADRASHVAGPALDAAVWELWPHLCCGAGVALADESTRKSSDLLREWIRAQDITVAFVPTALAEPMLAAEWPRQTKLRYLFTGAGTLHRHPSPSLPFAVVNNYGSTECTVVATSATVPAAPQSGGLPPIGTPIAHTKIYLLDRNRRPVAAGETGEIYIGGASVARGYRNRPDLTAERFLQDPFGKASGARMYRTGDLGRLLPSGQIAFHGRADNQEKIRGYRVEPDEVSGLLAQHPGVASCAVLAKGDPKTEKRLVAYVVARKGIAIATSELREFLAARLPEYMIPSAFVRLKTLPLNATGKLDREALPEPYEPTPPSSSAVVYRTPENPVEIRLAAMLADVLKVERVGLDDNFFILGGHTLLADRLLQRIRESFGVELTLRHLHEARTLVKLARQVEKLWAARLASASEEEARQMLREMESV
jgi:amino acid adenylation domain-containing protein